MGTKYIIDSDDLTAIANSIREKNGTTDSISFPEGFKNSISEISTSELNFTIVGGTVQPENPKENTIWVNTNQEITGYSFSATEPSSPTEGMVWIKTSTVSYCGAFNALKDNNISIYVNDLQQYVSGQWIVKTGYVYINSSWVLITTELLIYDTGMAYYAFGQSGYSKDNYPNYSQRGSVSYNTNGIYLVTTEVAGGSGAINFVGTNDAIDLTRYKTLSVSVSNATGPDSLTPGGTNDIICIAVIPIKRYPGSSSGGAYKCISSGATNATIDISSLNGSYYIVFTVTQWNGNTSTTVNIKRIVATM